MQLHRFPALWFSILLLLVQICVAPAAAIAQTVDCEKYAEETMRLFARASSLGIAADAQDGIWSGDRTQHQEACVTDPEKAIDLFRARRQAVVSAASTADQSPTSPSQSGVGNKALQLFSDNFPLFAVGGIVLLVLIVALTRLNGINSAAVRDPAPLDGGPVVAVAYSKPISGYVISALLGFLIVHAASDFIVQEIGISFTLAAYAAAAIIGATTGALFNAYAASLLGAFTGIIILLSVSGYIIY